MPHATATHPPAPSESPQTGSWWPTILLVLGVTVVRILYLALWCKYELVADEAQYWDWSRRLDWSYYSKGPGVAWTIAASVRLLGDHEWAVRLPTVLGAAIMALALAKLATEMARGDKRAGFLAAAAICLSPGYQVTALLMTIDGPFVACWALSCWAAWRLFETARAGRARTWAWPALALALGVGFLYKYTILLLIPGLIATAIFDRRRLKWNRAHVPGLLICVTLFVVSILPVVVWNNAHNWVTVRHLLGGANLAGGDHPPEPWHYSPKTLLDFLGSQIGVAGPFLMILFVWGVRRGINLIRSDASAWAREGFLICCAAPVLLFYFVLAIFKGVQGNWPIAGYASLIVLVAIVGPAELDHYREQVAAWRAEGSPRTPKRGVFGARPETLFQFCWHWTIGFGLITGFGVLFLSQLASIPVAGRIVPIWRIAGSRAVADQASRLVIDLKASTGRDPIIMSSTYGRAALLAFYMPGHPSVISAASYMGDRQSSYDYFPDTFAGNPQFDGRPAVMVGGTVGNWKECPGFLFEGFEPRPDIGAGPGEFGRPESAYVVRAFRNVPHAGHADTQPADTQPASTRPTE